MGQLKNKMNGKRKLASMGLVKKGFSGSKGGKVVKGLAGKLGTKMGVWGK